MDVLQTVFDASRGFLPFVGTVVLVVVALVIAQKTLLRTDHDVDGRTFRNQLIMTGLGFASLLVVILALPVTETTRGQLLSLIGILLSAAIALSSTTLLGNAMAGFMLRTVRHFRSGDFIRCESHVGRVSERGLFHTEIQTPDRELTTLSNIYLVSHPVTVIRSSGTIISATLSLGYDVPRDRIEAALLAAAGACELEEPFVHVMELGDFSVTYRIAGLLKDTKRVISTQSRLRAACLDALHEANIEIVSPNFMNQRVYDSKTTFVPEGGRRMTTRHRQPQVDDLVFDKAAEAENREQVIARLSAMKESIAAEREAAKTSKDEDNARVHTERAERLEARRARLEKILAEWEEPEDEE